MEYHAKQTINVLFILPSVSVGVSSWFFTFIIAAFPPFPLPDFACNKE